MRHLIFMYLYRLYVYYILTNYILLYKWFRLILNYFLLQGNFSTEYGGFIGVNIDLDDPTSTCGCDKPYPGFHYMVDGINGKDDSKPCKKFDRTP